MVKQELIKQLVEERCALAADWVRTGTLPGNTNASINEIWLHCLDTGLNKAAFWVKTYMDERED